VHDNSENELIDATHNRQWPHGVLGHALAGHGPGCPSYGLMYLYAEFAVALRNRGRESRNDLSTASIKNTADCQRQTYLNI
jgi:hypothetical protein